MFFRFLLKRAGIFEVDGGSWKKISWSHVNKESFLICNFLISIRHIIVALWKGVVAFPGLRNFGDFPTGTTGLCIRTFRLI